MKKQLTKLTILPAIFLLLLPVVCHALVINQDASTGSLQIQAYDPVGQSFNASDTNIGLVGVYIEPYNTFANDPTMELSLFSGAGDFSAAALLASEVFTLPNAFTGWLYLDVSSVNFSAGNDYTIGVFNDTVQWGLDVNWNDNPYALGNLYIAGMPTFGGDLVFSVDTKIQTSVPEPQLAMLLMFGLAAIFIARIRRSR